VREPAPKPELRGLVVDWGGVMTSGFDDAVAAWAAEDGIDLDRFDDVMRDWLGSGGDAEARVNPVHALERGEMEVPDFERRLAAALAVERPAVVADGLLDRQLRRFERAHAMTALVRRAHAAGIRTALLSNSWGTDYPRDGWADMFDVVVISGEVGMRKPEREIFEHTLRLLDLPAAACVFVDDLPHNVRAAVQIGFVGVVHETYEQTAAELDVLFGRQLSSQ
jgi:HAD superfamily hydrolase (TIGR01509 family)